MPSPTVLSEFARLHDILMGLLGKEPTGTYGCTSLDDIEGIYATHSDFAALAAEHGLTGDPRYEEAIEGVRKRRRQDYETISGKVNELEQGKTSESIRDVIYNTGAISHCWGHPYCWVPPLPIEDFNLADERFSKKQIEDGTYAKHNNPKCDTSL